MWNNNFNYNNFNRMPTSFGAPIQQIQEAQKTAQFYAVNSPAEMDAIRPDLNVVYIGMNKTKKEIYVRQLNTDGIITAEVYNLVGNEQKRDDINAIMEKLANIEKRLNNERFNTDVDKQADGGAVAKQSLNGAV